MTPDERSSLSPPQESRWGLWIAIILALLLAGAGWWWWQQQAMTALPSTVPASTAPAEPTGAAPVLAPEVPEPQPHNPIDALAPPDDALPALADGDDYVSQALQQLLGNGTVVSWLRLDGFVHRAVATVDNLAREQAPASKWPLQPTPERFTVSGEGAAQTISPNNAARYTALVQGLEAVNVQRAAALYARLYPMFQQAYEDLGYPGQYFNNRLVAVIDHLLQAPEPEGPVQVTLTEIKGNFPSTRPWVRYEFTDPQLQALSSGQKIMVRVGLANERRLKQRLRALRSAVATGEIAKAKP